MKLLIDTNVILDLVFNRANAAVSADVFRRISNNSDIALITASSATDLFYIIHKETHNSNTSYRIMEKILKITSIIPVIENDILTAMMLKWNDSVNYTLTNFTKYFPDQPLRKILSSIY